MCRVDNSWAVIYFQHLLPTELASFFYPCEVTRKISLALVNLQKSRKHNLTKNEVGWLVWLCGPWILKSSDGISHFSGIFPLARGWTTFYQTVGAPNCPGLGRDPTASSILTPHNSCDLTPPMCGTQQNWNLVWQEFPMTTTLPPRTKPRPRGLELILG